MGGWNLGGVETLISPHLIDHVGLMLMGFGYGHGHGRAEAYGMRMGTGSNFPRAVDRARFCVGCGIAMKHDLCTHRILEQSPVRQVSTNLHLCFAVRFALAGWSYTIFFVLSCQKFLRVYIRSGFSRDDIIITKAVM